MPLSLGMGDLKSLQGRVRVYRQLRRRSDLVRTQLIPTAVADGTPAGRAFFDMTKAYFDGNVSSGQLINTLDLSKANPSTDGDQPRVPTISELAAPRRQRCKITGFETVHPRYLKGISDTLFLAIDADQARRQGGEFDPDFLAIVNFALQLCHITEDGTGRTGEDMLVLLAAQSGCTLSISQTGYRGALEGGGYPLIYRWTALRILFFEVVENFYRFLGLAAPNPLSYKIDDIVSTLSRIGSTDGDNLHGWPDGLAPAIASIYKEISEDPGSDSALFEESHPYRFFAEFLACELIYFTLCLEAPCKYMQGLKSRYPASVNCFSHSLMFGLDRTYHPIADEIGEPCDEAVALIESVRLGWGERDESRLDKAVRRIEDEDATIGRLFRQELSSFLTEEEKTAIEFNIPNGMTGNQLEEQIRTGVRKIRG